ncbi:programmed cell death protein 7-like [Macrosteles quadrilineatus]|uniref:programmed cell death protein 7-like n=1 Tax=Macrosteles quadrilineatus TaxID=74068 RepID=UPI0023E1B988|nr:programmed cell death protein 7-like [Macrosteles quadrilineatus]
MDNRRWKESFPNSRPAFPHNPNLNIPPPPLPPRFPPPNVPLVVPPPAPFPPPTLPNNPTYPRQQFLPPASDSSVYPVPPWNGHSGRSVNQPPPLTESFTHNSGNVQGPPNQQLLFHTVVDRPPYSPSTWQSVVAHPANYQAPLAVNQPTIQSLQEPENPQDWVDHWTKNKKQRPLPKDDIKVYAIKEKLNSAFKLIRELENSSRTLGVMVKTVTSEEWHKKCSEVEDNKKKLTRLFNELNMTEEELNCLQEKLSKRTKKRARLRRQSQRLKSQKEEEKVKEHNLSVQIDNWMREMQERVERVKREEDMKKEADAVLWSVTQKKTEAKRQVAMLAALLNLRSVRVARLTAAGQPVSQSQIDTFNTVIERLKSMWSRHLEECQLEEQALRGMLGSNFSDTTDDVTTHRKLVLNEWEAAIFGTIGTLDTLLGPDELVQIRYSWDRFAVPIPSLLASAVPPGYVLPVPPSSESWRSFLKY